ncbi:MAG: AraC family transcriptional regulator [Paenibacillus sp.]|nr:AraC family transcriptional regulator [Paenibacillus sp.]
MNREKGYTPVDKCRYDCCISVPADLDADHGMDTAVFKGGKHVLYPFEETIEFDRRDLLIECYSELYSFWLPRSGYRYLGNPLELVSISSKPGTLDLDCRITAIALAIEPK